MFRASLRLEWYCSPSMFAKLDETIVAFTGSSPSMFFTTNPPEISSRGRLKIEPRLFLTSRPLSSTSSSELPSLLESWLFVCRIDLRLRQSLRRIVVLDKGNIPRSRRIGSVPSSRCGSLVRLVARRSVLSRRVCRVDRDLLVRDRRRVELRDALLRTGQIYHRSNRWV
jgi:hypothetical protein